jgi:pentatricopeptide repeat protein
MKFKQLNALYKNISKIGLRYNNITKINENIIINNNINNNINKIFVNNYHSSNINYGRKTGSNALEPSPRNFSKKQIKRKSKRIELRESKIDSRKEKIKDNFNKKQIESPHLKDLLASTNDSVINILDNLMLPGSGINENDFKNDNMMFGMNDSNNNVKKIIDPYTTLSLLRKNKRLSIILKEEENNLKLLNSSKDNIKQQQSDEIVNVDHIEDEISIKKSYISNIEDQFFYIFPNRANRSLVLLAKEQFSRKIDILEMLDLMNEYNIKVSVFSYTSLMLSASRNNDHEEVERLFNLMMSEDNEPDPLAWAALIRSKCKKSYSEAKKALELIDQLQKTGVKVTGSMFTSVLKAFVDGKNYKDSYALWERMHSEGIELTKESFISMLKLCAQQSNPERAFFYVDEMRLLGIELDTSVFASLFRACAEAPHWVNGYHDIIFDAMARMEGEELTPTPEIYNSIIYAFSRAGDAVASEFYFWEMRRKGIPMDAFTYNSLLNSFSKSQAIGAKDYGIKGRFVRPKDKEDTQFEKDYKALGATKSVESSKFIIIIILYYYYILLFLLLLSYIIIFIIIIINYFL